MTDTTRETLKAIAGILRVGADRRLAVLPTSDTAHTMHSIANEIVIALTLPDASREYTGASGNDE